MLPDLSKINDQSKETFFFFFFKRKTIALKEGLGSMPLIEKFNLSIAHLRLNRTAVSLECGI